MAKQNIKIGESDEPILVAQTFDQHHVATQQTMQMWIDECHNEAQAQGCTFFRVTSAVGNVGMLYEAWKRPPVDQGAPRWRLS